MNSLGLDVITLSQYKIIRLEERVSSIYLPIDLYPCIHHWIHRSNGLSLIHPSLIYVSTPDPSIHLSKLSKRSKEVLNGLGCQTLKQRRLEQTAIMMFKISNKMTPNYLQEMFQRDFGSQAYDLHSSDRNYVLPKNRTDYYNKSFAFTGAKVWNSLPNDLKQITSLETFKKRLKSIDLHRIQYVIFSLSSIQWMSQICK